jgi:hypothetical protein|eukprot:TRINITY_DN2343_c0_g1_i1.p2 TRINITY_DN2343_c0_g1~~TRINITY_DN2343_c0_g1_i1.p2  ORF type:complete len:365 (+),score=-92.55 TRINITY_DN2343_c0_g1_i1:1376-2470(+)
MKRLPPRERGGIVGGPTEPYHRPRIGREHPANLSILLTGGKETNRDVLSSGERSGRCPNRTAVPEGAAECGEDELARGRDGFQSVWKGGGTEGDSPYVLGPSPTSERIGESGRLRVQPEWGDRSHPRLSTWETPIANKYGDGKVKRTSKGGSKALEIVEGEADLTDETSSSLALDPRFVAEFRRARPPEPRRGGGREALGGGAACAGPASRRTRGRLGSPERTRRGAARRRGVGPREKEIASRGNGSNPRGPSPFPSREARGGGGLPGEARPQVFEWRRRDGPVRPVSKHGPRSLTRARARGREAHPRNESEWRDALPQGGGAAGRTSSRRTEPERSRRDPKGGDLSVRAAKPGETPVEARRRY